jgi:hypothetical protein
MGDFPAPWGGTCPRFLENTVSEGHCTNEVEPRIVRDVVGLIPAPWGGDFDYLVLTDIFPAHWGG